MISAVVDRSAGTAHIYYNKNEVTTGGYSIRNDFNNNATIQLGSMINGSLQMQGQIDDVRIYNRQLTAQEISDLYDQ